MTIDAEIEINNKQNLYFIYNKGCFFNKIPKLFHNEMKIILLQNPYYNNADYTK